MRQRKYFAEIENGTLTIKAYNMNEAKEFAENQGYKIIRIVSSEGYHLCKYCGRIVKGGNKDVLCDDCRRRFGHDLYSEL